MSKAPLTIQDSPSIIRAHKGAQTSKKLYATVQTSSQGQLIILATRIAAILHSTQFQLYVSTLIKYAQQLRRLPTEKQKPVTATPIANNTDPRLAISGDAPLAPLTMTQLAHLFTAVQCSFTSACFLTGDAMHTGPALATSKTDTQPALSRALATTSLAIPHSFFIALQFSKFDRAHAKSLCTIRENTVEPQPTNRLTNPLGASLFPQAQENCQTAHQHSQTMRTQRKPTSAPHSPDI